MTPAGRLTGQRALITGGGRSIGRATALAFAREGASVVVSARTQAEIDAVAAEIQAIGATGVARRADVARLADCEALIDQTLAALGGLDILVNNAGGGGQAKITELSEAEWYRAIDTNLTAAYRLSRLAIPAMARGGGGSIINVASTRALSGRRNAAGYCAAKAGLVNLTRAVALDYAELNIRCNCVCPGAIWTDYQLAFAQSVDDPTAFEGFLATQDPERQARFRRLRDNPAELANLRESNSPMRRRGAADEVAAAMVFLASTEASYMTGVILPVDGGRTAGE